MSDYVARRLLTLLENLYSAIKSLVGGAVKGLVGLEPRGAPAPPPDLPFWRTSSRSCYKIDLDPDLLTRRGSLLLVSSFWILSQVEQRRSSFCTRIFGDHQDLPSGGGGVCEIFVQMNHQQRPSLGEMYGSKLGGKASTGGNRRLSLP